MINGCCFKMIEIYSTHLKCFSYFKDKFMRIEMCISKICFLGLSCCLDLIIYSDFDCWRCLFLFILFHHHHCHGYKNERRMEKIYVCSSDIYEKKAANFSTRNLYKCTVVNVFFSNSILFYSFSTILVVLCAHKHNLKSN